MRLHPAVQNCHYGLRPRATSPEQKAARVRAAYAAMARGDIPAVGAFFAVDAIAHEYCGSAHIARYDGRVAIVNRLLDATPSYWEAFGVRLHTVACNARYVVALATWHGTSRYTGLTYTNLHIFVTRVDDHGAFTEAWLIRDVPQPGKDRPRNPEPAPTPVGPVLSAMADADEGCLEDREDR